MTSSERIAQQLETLMGLSATVNSSLEPAEIRRRAVEAAAALVDAERGSLLLVDQETRDLYFEVALGDTEGTLENVRLRRGQGIAGWVVENDEAVVINDVQSDPRYQKGLDRRSAFVTRQMICVPVRSSHRLLGALQAMNSRSGQFTEDDCSLLSALAHQVAVAIENSDLYGELKNAFYDTTAALADTIEKRDPYTGGHTQRVSRYARAISVEMGLTVEQIDSIGLAATLHDIGKIGVPDYVLLKPDRLDDDELTLMRAHPATAADILSHVHSLAEVIPGVVAHHERMNGSGYPEGLSGEQIPLAARIVAVADTFDAMTTSRPYHPAKPAHEALAELRACAGDLFDRQVVDAFETVLEWLGTGN